MVPGLTGEVMFVDDAGGVHIAWANGSTLAAIHGIDVIRMNSEFPVLKPGANAISWTGTVTKVVVRPNWRFL